MIHLSEIRERRKKAIDAENYTDKLFARDELIVTDIPALLSALEEAREVIEYLKPLWEATEIADKAEAVLEEVKP